ncbi:MAG: glutamate formimidoyltransferase [Acidobacteria bacterium]|nr:glutamate formimidoyltransferase [Acidobacteriota bacterium]
MHALVECVPNFSEGRDRAVIDRIVAAIAEVDGVKVFDVDPGADTNRTVVTFIGTPAAVAEAAFAGIRQAAELIDMRRHAGAHPRMGATDVCPFIPVAGVTMADCTRLARQVGRRVAEELQIPVYLYEESATRPERRNLADIRQGEYEGLAAKLSDPEWVPDFGAATFNPQSGATVMGAREFLIAYNINFNTRDRRLVNDIALNIRERGRAKRDDEGKIVRDEDGSQMMVPGVFQGLKAIGWYIEEYGCAQLSMNITNYKVSPVHEIFDEVCRQAAERGLRVTGSELVGLIPKAAVVAAGEHFLRKQGKSTGVPEEELVHIAVKSLGLDELSPFEARRKIIEYAVEEENPPRLVRMNLRDFANELSTDSPAPGGGSVASLAGALGAALAAMVSNLTMGKKGYEAVQEEMVRIGVAGQQLKEEFLADIDLDTEAFDRLMDAFRLPKKSDEEKAARQAAVVEATKGAIAVPLRVLKRTIAALGLVKAVAQKGNQNSLSDAGVGGLMALAAARGACYNVLINLQGLDDADYVHRTRTEAAEALQVATGLAGEVAALVEKALAGEDSATG